METDSLESGWRHNTGPQGADEPATAHQGQRVICFSRVALVCVPLRLWIPPDYSPFTDYQTLNPVSFSCYLKIQHPERPVLQPRVQVTGNDKAGDWLQSPAWHSAGDPTVLLSTLEWNSVEMVSLVVTTYFLNLAGKNVIYEFSFFSTLGQYFHLYYICSLDKTRLWRKNTQQTLVPFNFSQVLP